MSKVLSQLAIVAALGLALGLAVGTARGFPTWTSTTAAGAATCTSPVPDRPEIGWIGAGQAHRLWENGQATFFDARDRKPYLMGHVPGSIHAPTTTGALEPAVVERAPTVGAIVVYDDAEQDCAYSVRLARLLAAAGRDEVWVLEGGLPAWLTAGYPAESGSGESAH
jgi:3-mercaptopyruvate sulfurtransferase SseA